MAEQHEILVRHPAQERCGSGRLALARRGGDLLLGRVQQADHGGVVGDGQAHIGHGARQQPLQLRPAAGALARQHGDLRGADRDPHHAFTPGGGGVRALRHHPAERQQPPGAVAPHRHDRVQELPHHASLPGKRGERAVHQERHVVGDDLHDRMRAAARPRRQHPQLGLSRRALAGKGEEARRRLRHRLGRNAGKLRAGHVGEEAAEQHRRIRRQVGRQAPKRRLGLLKERLARRIVLWRAAVARVRA